eukprot:12438377-Ditylum_brightwellii.AAC.1
MALQANPGNDNYIGSFHEGFEPGLQGGGTGWSIVNNNKNSGKKNKEKQGKTTTKTGEKQKINLDAMEEENDEDPIEITNTTVQEQIQAAGEKDIGKHTQHISSL